MQVRIVDRVTVLLDVTPFSSVIHRRFGGAFCVRLQVRRMREASSSKKQAERGGWLDYSLTYEMEAVRSSETSVKFYRTALHHIAKNGTFPSHAARSSLRADVRRAWMCRLGAS
jgi:hypothetical protein